jgi:predicted ABC-type transport system involved in lysophospholipase L1 biosynthesis ATPase subunit
MLVANDIHKTYTIGKKHVPVLKGASLEVGKGEALAVVGISGAGKSTLLHVLGGLDRPDQGQVLMETRDLYGLSERQRAILRASRIGFVFQSYHLLPEMDIFENVYLPSMAVSGGDSDAARTRTRELLAAVGLEERAHHTPMELSGGEQQRAALARALINEPEIVLADEPTGNLDEETGRQVLACLFSLTRDRGHSLILVTHNAGIAASCTRTLRLADGMLADA